MFNCVEDVCWVDNNECGPSNIMLSAVYLVLIEVSHQHVVEGDTSYY